MHLSAVSLQLVYSVCSLQAQSTQAEKCLDVSMCCSLVCSDAVTAVVLLLQTLQTKQSVCSDCSLCLGHLSDTAVSFTAALPAAKSNQAAIGET